ncbi:MAG TPA: DUF4349 domain-containing protein [Pedococcus sp.]|jgi:hypothetical protein|uniref:DUF4349 domain-containing protein n=1 Tax=Pedococcus sp. TaxID=2860345 RepID=UPI002F93A45A
MTVKHPFPRLTALLAAAAASAVLLSACSGGGSDSGGETAAGSAPDQGGSVSRDAGGDVREGSGTAAKPAQPGQPGGTVDPARLTAVTEHMVRSARLALTVKSIAAAASSVRSISAANQGIVLSENIGGSSGDVVPLDDPSRVTATTYGEITISVPAGRLDPTVDELSRIGTVIRRESSSQNVHDQYVDTESRIKTMQASVDRVRALMTRATDIGQIVTLEAELSRRQADLEALESQLAALKDQIARSPIQVSLTTDSGVIAEDPGTGFLAGLKGGWEAFTASLVVLLTVIGAVLPFAFVLALVGLPLWWSIRRRRGGPTTPTTTAPPAAATQ